MSVQVWQLCSCKQSVSLCKYQTLSNPMKQNQIRERLCKCYTLYKHTYVNVHSQVGVFLKKFNSSKAFLASCFPLWYLVLLPWLAEPLQSCVCASSVFSVLLSCPFFHFSSCCVLWVRAWPPILHREANCQRFSLPWRLTLTRTACHRHLMSEWAQNNLVSWFFVFTST